MLKCLAVFVFFLFSVNVSGFALTPKKEVVVRAVDKKKIRKELSELIVVAEDWLNTKRKEHQKELNMLNKEKWGQTIYQQPSIEKLRRHSLEDFVNDIENYFRYFDQVIDVILQPLQPLTFSEVDWLYKEYKNYLDFQAKCAVEVQRIKGE